MSTSAVAPERLREWVGELLDGEVVQWQRLRTGNSRSTFAADVRVDAHVLPVVVRHDEGGGPVAGTELSLGREATVYGALGASGLPVPHLYGRSSELRAIAVSRLPGSTAESGAVLDDLLDRLAELHQLPADELVLPGFARRAADDLELWARIAELKLHDGSQLVELAVEILRDVFPGEPERIVLCHGDYGVGNFLVDDGRITALLDWEFAHLGDPHDDLAWITVRALMYGHELPGFGEHVRSRYAARTGMRLSPQRLRYWQAVVILRNLICCLSVAQAREARDASVHLMLLPGLAFRLVRLLAELCRVELARAPALPAAPEPPGGLLLSEVSGGLRELAAAIADPTTRRRARRLERMLEQFAQTWRDAAAVAQANAADRAAAGPGRIPQLRALGRITERELALLPRASPIAGGLLAGLEDVP